MRSKLYAVGFGELGFYQFCNKSEICDQQKQIQMYILSGYVNHAHLSRYW